MPLLAPVLPELFTISIFGAQYHGTSPPPPKAILIRTFEASLKASAVFVEELIQDDSERGLGLSRIWVSYWKSPDDYYQWWESQEVSQFWSSLPDDAGFWRERMHFSKTRFVTEMSQDIPSGVGHLGPLEPLTEKTGYWGALRDRIEESTAEDKLPSPLEFVPAPKLPDGTIRRGRVKMTKFPENICYVIEGQDHSLMKEHEGKIWSEKFHRATKRFVTNAVRAGPEGGVLSARLCHVPESGTINVKPSEIPDDPDIFPALEINRTVEIFYFLEFRYMERVGRRDKAHVALRREFMDVYGKERIMAHGDMLVWVDCGILKSNEIEAEYIGCYEGTGFLAYDYHPEFKSTTVSRSNGAWARFQGILGRA
ncbi:aldoxime dehydratase [Lipomyces kononenkoae]|uniref:Aldoxime dehydratase n=1 Tax=Lipomyces kononenkoae TaxID=34357 RepID=A0ACC3T2Q3_LIPKO